MPEKLDERVGAVVRDPASELSTVLVSTAFLDGGLQHLLFMKMNLSEEEANRIFGRKGCLRDFYAKIEKAYAFELIDGDVRQDLHVIRDIRNEFAHPPMYRSDFAYPPMHPLSFRSPEILELVQNFKGWNTGVSDAFEFFNTRVRSYLEQIDRQIDQRLFATATATDPLV
jgi:hypothetical protein